MGGMHPSSIAIQNAGRVQALLPGLPAYLPRCFGWLMRAKTTPTNTASCRQAMMIWMEIIQEAVQHCWGPVLPYPAMQGCMWVGGWGGVRVLGGCACVEGLS